VGLVGQRESERGGALTGGTGLLVGVGGREVAACAERAQEGEGGPSSDE
jgi:hypothetical protein